MKKYIMMLCIIGWSTISIAQITFNSCHPLFDNQDFMLNQISMDATGRNVFETIPIDGDQPCSGVGICEFRISWNNTLSQWEIIADDGSGDFSTPFLIYSNSEDSMPNPPSLVLGTWVENNIDTEGTCGGDLTAMNAVLTGDVQDTTLGVDEFSVETQISIYPNPVKNTLYINHQNLNLDKVSLYDVFGKLVIDADQSHVVDVSQLNAGLYFVRIQVNDQALVKKLIIK